MERRYVCMYVPLMIALRDLEIISLNIFSHSSVFRTMVSHTLHSPFALALIVKNYKKRQMLDNLNQSFRIWIVYAAEAIFTNVSRKYSRRTIFTEYWRNNNEPRGH